MRPTKPIFQTCQAQIGIGYNELARNDGQQGGSSFEVNRAGEVYLCSLPWNFNGCQKEYPFHAKGRSVWVNPACLEWTLTSINFSVMFTNSNLAAMSE